ncbi:hypothetical protein [Fluviispira multicolorata]|uniref:Uncharacterized protein n=1 Tax=Fluviispira multicolorata TaxID=2654512 RepID=A0A833JBX4_9BACT|nr:hypothetical protein [Fluviispira multicolorata]KAB8029863.1 hypothetical protein GCL57_10010 [Fluviispira multicolorata]
MKRIIISSSYLYFFIINTISSAYGQETSVTIKDTNGNDVLYCQDYKIKLNDYNLTHLFNEGDKANYLIKSNTEYSKIQIIQIGKECHSPVFVDENIVISFTDASDEYKYLIYSPKIPNTPSNAYYYTGATALSTFSLTETNTKDKKYTYNLVNQADDRVLACHEQLCTSTTKRIGKRNINANLTFEPLKIATVTPTAPQSPSDLWSKLYQLTENAAKEFSDDLARHEYDRRIKDEAERIEQQVKETAKKLSDDLARQEYDRRIKDEAKLIEQQVKETAKKLSDDLAKQEYDRRIKDEAKRIEQQAKNFFKKLF